MNNLEHLLISLCIQAVIGLVTSNWWVGAAVCAALFIGREQAQAEYRWIAQFGDGKRENLRWWNALDPKVWNTHNFVWNLALPTVAVTIIGVML
jgi:hypothetical protein